MKKARANKLVTLALHVKNRNTRSSACTDVFNNDSESNELKQTESLSKGMNINNSLIEINVSQSKNSIDLIETSNLAVDLKPNKNVEEKYIEYYNSDSNDLKQTERSSEGMDIDSSVIDINAIQSENSIDLFETSTSAVDSKLNENIDEKYIEYYNSDSNGSLLFEVDSDESYRPPGDNIVSESSNDEFDNIATNLTETNVIQPDVNIDTFTETNTSDNGSCETEVVQKNRKSRKANPDLWKRTIVKKKRLSGEKYTN